MALGSPKYFYTEYHFSTEHFFLNPRVAVEHFRAVSAPMHDSDLRGEGLSVGSSFWRTGLAFFDCRALPCLGCAFLSLSERLVLSSVACPPISFLRCLTLSLVVSRSPSLIAYCCAAMLAKSCSFLVVWLCPSRLPQLVLSWPIGFFVCLFLMSALSFSLMIALQGRLAIAWPVPFNSVEGPSVP